MARYKFNGKEIPFPSIEGVEFIVEHLHNLGWASSNGMGMEPISFREIEAYINTTHAHITANEVMLIRKMSLEYIRHSSNKNPAIKPPFSE